MTDGDERVLEWYPALVMCVNVAGSDGVYAQRLGELAQSRVSTAVAALVRSLELDEEALGAKSRRHSRSRIRIVDGKTAARTARQAHEALVQLE